MLFWILLIVLIAALVGSAPVFPHSRDWGYRPASIIAGLVLLVFLLWIFGFFPGAATTDPTLTPAPLVP